MRRILLVDCFDSFTYNIYHYLDQINQGNCHVVRYDEFKPSAVKDFTHIVFSPGPGLPEDYPKIDLFFTLRAPSQNVLGVCLGHQCIARHFGGKLEQLKQVRHGIQGKLSSERNSILFDNTTNEMHIGHYHSWVVSDVDFPMNDLNITSRTEDGWIMSIEHKEAPIYGLQFHPESVLTSQGKKVLENWLLKTKSS